MNTKGLSKDWNSYIKFIEAHKKDAGAFNAESCSVGGSAIAYHLDLQADIFKNTAHSIVCALISHAENKFSPSLDIRLNIDRDDILGKFPIEFYGDYTPDKFNPAAVWDYLTEEYGGESGKNIALREVATKIINGFNLCTSSEVKLKSGFHILNQSVDIDDFEKKWNGETRLSWGSRNKTDTILSALASFFEWAGEFESKDSLVMQRSDFISQRNVLVTSREKITLCDSIQLVTFQTRFEYRFKPEAAKALQLFLGKFGIIPTRPSYY